MKLRTQFFTILLLAFGSLSILLILGRQRLSEAVADTESIVDQQFNPLVLENAPRLQETYQGLTGLLNTIRDATQARIAQITSTSLTNSEEIQQLIQNAKDSLDNMEATLEVVPQAFPATLKQNWESHRNVIDNWIAEERHTLLLSEELSQSIARRAHFHNKSAQTFIPFRHSLDLLGERADAQLNALQTLQPNQIAAIGKAVSLILNADRDCYQALIGEQDIIHGDELDPETFQYLRHDYQENMAQIPRRLQEAKTHLSGSEDFGFDIVFDLYAKWAEQSQAAVTITDQILDKLRQRKTHIAKANQAFHQSQNWLAEAHSQLKTIAFAEINAFESARDQALATSDNIRLRARSYLTLFNALGILAFLCFLVLIVFQRRLVSNLMRLSSYLSELDEAKLGNPYVMPKQSVLPSIELSQLTQNLNAMRERLVEIIQAHKDALKNLTRSETRFSNLFYNSVSPAILANPRTGQIVDANQAATKLYQYPLEQLKDQSLATLDAGGTGTQIHGIAAQIQSLDATKSLQFQSLQQKADQSPFTAQVHAGIVEIDEDQLALILLNDVSKKVEFEQQLLQAKEAAEAASRAKDDFLSVMSHELRTPLNPIIGYAQLLEVGATDPQTSQFTRSISASAHRMLGIVERILHFAQLSQDSSIANSETFTLETLLEEPKSYAQINAAPQQTNFHNGNDSLQALLPDTRIKGAKNNFVQILLNLLENAIKYSKGAAIDITIGLQKTDQKTTLHIIAQDEGPGIPPSYRSSLFAPFTQADSSYARPYEGLGLGLAICQKLAHQAGGQIAFQPKRPRGCRFSATFPIELEQKKTPTPSPSTQPANTPAPNTKILLVEDNPENAEYLSYVLNDFGFQVDHASTGAQALEKAQTSRYAAALIDISLQDMDGLQILENLKKIPSYEHTKNIAVTAHASTALKTTCLATGFHDFLTKPVSPIQLGDSLALHLATR